MKLKSFSRARRRSGPSDVSSTAGSPRQRHRGWWIALVGVLVLLALVRFVGSPIMKSFLNERLATMPDYIGRVDSVSLALWRGAVDVREFVLYERGFENEPPLVHLREASVVFAPSALIRGRLAGRMVVEGAELNLVKRIDDDTAAGGRTAEERKAELEAEAREKKEAIKRWQDELRSAMPLELTRFELRKGRVRIVDTSKDPQAELVLQNLHVVATDIRNRPRPESDPLPAKVRVNGEFAGGGQVRAGVQLDPLAEQPRFSGDFEVRGLALPPINGFLLAYANADVSQGTFEVYSELEARDGGYEGYVKPLFHDLNFETAHDDRKNVAERVAETVVSAVASVFENEEKDQVAAKAPISGNFADNDVDIWTTIATLFRNAFVQALRGGFDNQEPTARK